MSNTYAKIKKYIHNDEETTEMYLTLSAIMNKKFHTQLSVTTYSTISCMSGTAYIMLDDKDVDLLIGALLERKVKMISATGCEKSIFCPNDD